MYHEPLQCTNCCPLVILHEGSVKTLSGLCFVFIKNCPHNIDVSRSFHAWVSPSALTALLLFPLPHAF